MTLSNTWKQWVAKIDLKTCYQCRKNHGKIYALEENVYPSPPIHSNCRCVIERMKVLFAGTATSKGVNGADWYLKHRGKLPDYYISKTEAKYLGWDNKKGNLSTVIPKIMIGGGRYYNENTKLPSKIGRLWYEADINYVKGRRNAQRIVYSNDGLIFITYDHYETFTEIQ